MAFEEMLETLKWESRGMSADKAEHYRMFIDGGWVAAADGETFESTDPYTGKVWAVLPRGKKVDAGQAIDAAEKALGGEWGRLTPS
ncbi:UNVERIFIED_CONTAM: aldehyde dehydrogenase family protein, partial [Bacteroidetes bacterium 56_B9]